MPLVAAPATFAGALPGSHALPPIVQPLGHEVSPLATPGLVVARTRPVEVAGAGSLPAPVQRRAARGSRAVPAAAASPVPAPEPDVIDHVAHAAPPVAAAPVAPIRSMPTVSRQAVRVPDRPLTNASSAARPAAVQRAAAAAASAESGATGATSPPASGGMRRVPASMPVAKPVVSRQASAAEAHPPAPAVAAAASAPSRSGVGEPMTSLPASVRHAVSPGPVVSRSTTSGPMPIAASSLRTPVQRSAGPASNAPQLALGSGSPSGSAAATAPRLPDLPHLPVARAGGSGSSAVAPAVAAPVQTSAAASRPEIRPIAGANPIRTTIPLQRDAVDDLDEDAIDESALPSPWWGSSEGPSRPMAHGSAATADGSSASLQRSRADDAAFPSMISGGAASRTPAAAPAVSSGRSPVQRIAGPATRQSLPALTLPHAPAGPGASTTASDAGRPSISFPAATGGPPSVQTSLMRASAPLAAGFTSPNAGAVVQREGGNVSIHAQEPAPPTGPAGPTPVVSGPGPIAPAGSAGSSRSEKDLDELAQALFGRIRGRLRSDLIYDREAKGLTFDNV